jgi:dihydrolipoamide dehydrogenase
MLAHKAEEEPQRSNTSRKATDTSTTAPSRPSYTHPEWRGSGRAEAEVKASGVKYKVGSSFSANSRAKTNLETDGMVKFIADAETDRILGIHIVGANAGEMIAEASWPLVWCFIGGCGEDESCIRRSRGV